MNHFAVIFSFRVLNGLNVVKCKKLKQTKILSFQLILSKLLEAVYPIYINFQLPHFVQLCTLDFWMKLMFLGRFSVQFRNT